MPSYRGGLQSITSSGVIGTSGKPIRVFAISVLSAASPGAPVFYNNTAASGNEILDGTGLTASKAVLIANIPTEGMLFPSGLFVTVDGNSTQVNVWYEQEIT